MSIKSPTKRPHVSVNMAMSLDGKISTYRREDISLGTEHDRRLMDELRADADAVIVGSGTVANDGFPILMRHDDLKARRVDRGWPPHPINVTMSRALHLPSTRPFFQNPDTEKIVFTTRAAPASRVKRFSRLADVVVLPGRTLSPTAVLDNRPAGMARDAVRGLRASNSVSINRLVAIPNVRPVTIAAVIHRKSAAEGHPPDTRNSVK